jgi:outer membrane lipoprotein-sorting protein
MRIARTALWLILLGIAPAWAETLDEALARLDQAAKAVKDLTTKHTITVTLGLQGMGMKSTILADTQRLRDGGKVLLRAACQVTTKMGNPAAAPAAALEIKNSLVRVYDGTTCWLEQIVPGVERPQVAKIDPPVPPEHGWGLDFGDDNAHALLMNFEEGGAGATSKLLGKGNLAGRATTLVEITVPLGELPKGMEEAKSVVPTKAVVQFDDATGFPLALTATNSDGQELIKVETSEIKANAGLAKDLFKYTAPPNAEIAPDEEDQPEPPAEPKGKDAERKKK